MVAVDKPIKVKDKGKCKGKKTPPPKVRLVFNEEDAKAVFESFVDGPAKVGSVDSHWRVSLEGELGG